MFHCVHIFKGPFIHIEYCLVIPHYFLNWQAIVPQFQVPVPNFYFIQNIFFFFSIYSRVMIDFVDWIEICLLNGLFRGKKTNNQIPLKQQNISKFSISLKDFRFDWNLSIFEFHKAENEWNSLKKSSKDPNLFANENLMVHWEKKNKEDRFHFFTLYHWLTVCRLSLAGAMQWLNFFYFFFQLESLSWYVGLQFE